jgi:hypothetical protein
MTQTKPFTHSGFIFKTEELIKGRRVGRWINEGDARLELDGSISIHLHSTPIGGFDGQIRCLKIGCKPPEEVPAVPSRPLKETDDNRQDEAMASCASRPDSLFLAYPQSQAHS